MKTIAILLGLALWGCAAQPTGQMEPVSEKLDIHVFYEEPEIEYRELGKVDETKRADHPMDVLEQVLRKAMALGADGVIVHSIRNRGTVAGLGDAFGTGGGGGFAVYQVQATAITYDQEY